MISLHRDQVTLQDRQRELDAINRLFERLYAKTAITPYVIREFVDATTAAQSRYLPDGTVNPDKDYYFIKTDASVNTVTIYPFGTQTIVGGASYILAAQYDRVWLAWDSATRVWCILQ